MAAPPSNAIPPIVGLLVRVITFFCLFISMVVLATNKVKIVTGEYAHDYDGDLYFSVYTISAKFHIFYAYRYLLSCVVIGIAYTIVQIAASVIHVTSGRRISEFLENLDFYPDLILSNLLISGAAASFGLTVDLKRTDFDLDDKFFEKIYASSSMCLIAFVFAAITTIISHLNSTRKSIA